MTISPARQSTLPSSRPATSAARKPRRANSVRMAKSRRPVGWLRSQLASSALTSEAVTVAGSPVSRQPATGGTAVANAVGVRPSRNKNRSSDRKSVTTPLADLTASREHSPSRNVVTSAPLKSSTPVLRPAPVRRFKKPAGGGLVAADGWSCQAPILDQPVVIALYHRVDRRGRPGIRHRRDDLAIPE